VGREVLGGAQGGHRPGRPRPGVAVEGGHLHGPQEVEGGQAGGEPGRAGGRQDVVGAGGVVAEGDRRPGPDEHRPGVADPGGQLARVGDQQLQVLGGERLGHPEHGRPVVAEHDRGLAGEGGLDPVAVGGGRHLLGELGLDRLPQVGVVGDQQAGGQRVVLGLGDQVDGDQRGSAVASASTATSVGPANRRSDPPGHLPLGQGD
jgi:hypothetical protein